MVALPMTRRDMVMTDETDHQEDRARGLCDMAGAINISFNIIEGNFREI